MNADQEQVFSQLLEQFEKSNQSLGYMKGSGYPQRQIQQQRSNVNSARKGIIVFLRTLNIEVHHDASHS